MEEKMRLKEKKIMLQIIHILKKKETILMNVNFQLYISTLLQIKKDMWFVWEIQQWENMLL